MSRRTTNHETGTRGIDTISSLVRDPNNARKHPERNIEMLAGSLEDVGAARSIVIDENHQLLAGEGVTRAAERVGITKLKIVDADGDTLVAVRRTGLTAEQKMRLALYDNRTAELAEWDSSVIAALRDDRVDLGALWTEAELSQLIQGPQGDPQSADQEPASGDQEDHDPTDRYGVIVLCINEAEQRRTYDALLANGYRVRVVVV